MAELDRRIRRTRRTLHEALIALILEQGYERTTVQDILDRADVGRSTFYAHYRDKEALLLATFDDMRERLRGQVRAGTALPDPAGPVDAVFAHAHDNRRVYRALCGRQGGDVVRRHLHVLIADLLRAQLPADAGPARDALPGEDVPGEGVPADLVGEFYASAAVGLLTWWIDHDFPYGPARMAHAYRQLAAPGIRAAVAASR